MKNCLRQTVSLNAPISNRIFPTSLRINAVWNPYSIEPAYCVFFSQTDCEMYLTLLVCILYSASDGMSRTGVFIAVMCEMERIKMEGEVDVFHTVKAMRKKRPHMVYTKVRTLALALWVFMYLLNFIAAHTLSFTCVYSYLCRYTQLTTWYVCNQTLHTIICITWFSSVC